MFIKSIIRKTYILCLSVNRYTGNGRARDRESRLDPPFCQRNGDLQKWRRKVAPWVDMIRSAAERGTDRVYKTVFATLGRQLSERGLPSAQQLVVDESQAAKTIYFRQSDQVAAVRDIVNLIAIDPPIAMVSRPISSFNKIAPCRRRKIEDLSVFVSRFQGLAAEHRIHSNASTFSQIGEVLAITLLNNANLEEGTLANAKLHLMSLAESLAIHVK